MTYTPDDGLMRLEPDMYDQFPDDFPLPPAYAAKRAAHEAAWNAWDEALGTLVDAEGDLELARRRDTDALRAALRAGEPDPGTMHQQAAERAAVVAQENLRIKLEDARKAALDARMRPKQALIDTAAGYVIAQMDAYEEAETAIRRRIAELEDQLARLRPNYDLFWQLAAPTDINLRYWEGRRDSLRTSDERRRFIASHTSDDAPENVKPWRQQEPDRANQL